MASSLKPRLHLYPSYLSMIENGVDSKLFRNLYFHIDDRSIDVLEDGDLSCAMFVSTLLHTFGLIKKLHTTVIKTLEDIKESEWYEIKEPRKGALVHWSFKKKDDGTQGKHHHVGFYIDAETAISNDPVTRTIAKHHLTYGELPGGEVRREVLAYYWHPKLDER